MGVMILTRPPDIQMSEGLLNDSSIKQDSTTPAPGTTPFTLMSSTISMLTSQPVVTKR